MKFISLFSGIGGFDLGFERAGMQCVAQVEWNAKASAVLAKHYPNVQRFGDVRDVGKHNLGSVDLICGGFPCQDVSVAGRRAGLAGERSGLWFEFHRILTEVTPRWVVIENVPGLLSSQGGRDFATLLHGLVECGYRVCWRVLDAQYFGVPQRRRRVFIVGYLGDGRAAEVLFEREGCVWNSPPRREAGQELARDVAASLRARGAGTSTRIDNETGLAVVTGTLSGSGAGTARTGIARSEADMLVFDRQRSDEYGEGEIASSLSARDYKSATDLIAYNITFCDANGRRKDRPNGGLYVNETEQANTLTEAGQTAQTVITREERIDRWIETGEKIRAVRGDSKQSGIQEHVYHKPEGVTDALTRVRPAKVITAFTETAKTLTQNYGKQPDSSDSSTPGNFVGSRGIVRRLTPTECERLQGFPDGWTAGQSDSERYRQLGNAVAVPMAAWIGRRIATLD